MSSIKYFEDKAISFEAESVMNECANWFQEQPLSVQTEFLERATGSDLFLTAYLPALKPIIKDKKLYQRCCFNVIKASSNKGEKALNALELIESEMMLQEALEGPFYTYKNRNLILKVLKGHVEKSKDFLCKYLGRTYEKVDLSDINRPVGQSSSYENLVLLSLLINKFGFKPVASELNTEVMCDCFIDLGFRPFDILPYVNSIKIKSLILNQYT